MLFNLAISLLSVSSILPASVLGNPTPPKITCGVNATVCNAGGAVLCSYGKPTKPSGGGQAACVAAFCPSTPRYFQGVSQDGKSCIECGTNATECTSAGALMCLYGIPTKPSDGGKIACTAAVCPSTPRYFQGISQDGKLCFQCGTNATTCDYTGALTCSYGIPTKSSRGKTVCAAANCPSTPRLFQGVASDGKSCILCPQYATSCDSTGALTCEYGYGSPSRGRCVLARCGRGIARSADGISCCANACTSACSSSKVALNCSSDCTLVETESADGKSYPVCQPAFAISNYGPYYSFGRQPKINSFHSQEATLEVCARHVYQWAAAANTTYLTSWNQGTSTCSAYAADSRVIYVNQTKSSSDDTLIIDGTCAQTTRGRPGRSFSKSCKDQQIPTNGI